MGHSLYMHRSDGRDGHLSPVDLPQALALFHDMPWKEDVAHWMAQPPETREEFRPLFRLSDDAGCSLHITAYSDDLLAFLYAYPCQTSLAGFVATEQEENVGTDQYPRSEVGALLEAFFNDDRAAILRMIAEYPSEEGEVE